MTKKVILVTSGQPSINPRLVKEADALAGSGYEVTVFYAYWNEWATKYDEQLLAKSKWKAVRVGGSPTEGRLTYFFSRVLHKFIRIFHHPSLAVWALSRASFHLLQEVTKHKADLYIAHNLGALPAAFKAAKKYGKPCGFDAEDFHRNEVSDDVTDASVKRNAAIESRYFPLLTYLTTSSPQIAEMYKKLFPAIKPEVILNVFTKSAIKITSPHQSVKLFWFSQTIGGSRGIEGVVEALSALDKNHFELHLLGDLPVHSKPFIEQLKSTGINVFVHAPIPPDELIVFASKFDIGLALEKETPLNRDLCLTNKLFTYMQAGLAVIATQTTAQTAFMQQNPSIGTTYHSGDVEALAGILSDFQQNSEKLLACKEESLRLAHEKYNWDMESQKFLKLVAQTI